MENIIFSMFFSIIDFLILLVPLSLICFVLYFPLKRLELYFEDKFSLTWIKSTFLLNFIIVLVPLILMYLYFVSVGNFLGTYFGPELGLNIFDEIIIFLVALIRIIVISVIFGLSLLFFELVSSFIMDFQEGKEYNELVKKYVSVLGSCILFLVLFLFVFYWIPLAITIFIFFGGINELPLLFMNFQNLSGLVTYLMLI